MKRIKRKPPQPVDMVALNKMMNEIAEKAALNEKALTDVYLTGQADCKSLSDMALRQSELDLIGFGAFPQQGKNETINKGEINLP